MSGLNAARLYVPDCIGASRSIFARDGPALLKAVSTEAEAEALWELGKQWLHAECVLYVLCVPL